MAAADSRDLLTEFRLIERFFARPGAPGEGVVLGIGDDAAITRCPPDAQLVTATDMLVEGTHFLPAAPARSIGHRALAVNLSDLAAMGARPLWASLALSLPAADEAWLQAFADGFFALADRTGVSLIGGDTVRGPLSITVTVQGAIGIGRAALRTQAQTGDSVFCTGAPGAAAAGRALLSEAGSNQELCERFLFPEPRLEFGAAAAGIVSAMIDISDGLHADLCQLLRASHKGASLDIDALPLGFMTDRGLSEEAALDCALGGGEDFELLFTVAPAFQAEVLQLAAQCGVPATRIGQITAAGDALWCRNGMPIEAPISIYRHFEG